MNSTLPDDLTAGVTVLVRTYQGVDRIERTLDSIRAQTLSKDLYEVLVVPNGPADGTLDVLRRYRESHPELEIRIVTAPDKGIGLSMNVGIAAARRSYLTVVDDDDQISANFLKTLYQYAAPHCIAHAYLANLDGDGIGFPDYDTYVNRSLVKAIGRTTHPVEAAASMMFNVSKLVWTPYARAVRARENLRFATDVLYWHELVNTFGLKITVLPTNAHAVYYRSLRTDSHSRPASVPYDLAIEARLDVIEALVPIANDPTQYLNEVAQLSIISQAAAMGRYLAEHPDENRRVIDSMSARIINPWVYHHLNRKRARDLVTCYAFLPSNNTSALVAARRVRERGVCVDVVSHQMDGVHGRDVAAGVIVEPFIGNHLSIPGRPTFSQWRGVVEFCAAGMSAIERWEHTRGRSYRSVYSRAMWPSSHVLAALYKVRHPETTWIAEFSDPLSENVEGETRKAGTRDDDALSREIEEGLEAAGHPLPHHLGLLQWIEHIAYALADEIVFTNTLQQQTMLTDIADETLHDRVVEHTRISPHPTLPPEFYQISDVAYPLEPGLTHVAYFGAFYPTRGLTEVTDAIRALPREYRDRLRFHVFTKDPEDLRTELRKASLDDTVITNHYVPYLDFLHLTTLFDCLLVNDARTADTHPVNPYLPSKISDYDGSGRPVWAVVEPGSSLSERKVAYSSVLGDVDGAIAVLKALTGAHVRAGAEVSSSDLLPR
ncbi:glycosyltransferase [Aeromicrobium sp.]|uniref:glycosyltransferase n=1 Tax=Aeromicrobium sp. TaxID=1871063 RepID=UPI001998D4D2|nr:glycosyltransferase [Aeromicrobium sp.]MBC7630891.1 glycosyltransferase [Aeromicrobium sp.]